MVRKLIVGLGNPGKKYEKTRHNVGFMILDALAEKFDVAFELKKNLEATVSEIPGAILAKPLTFMNESGRAVARLINFYKISLSDLLVTHDEIDLPLGEIKISNGGSAGHKGVESIIKGVGGGFTRLRIGIENRQEYRVPETEDYVLQNFTGEEIKKLKEGMLPTAISLIERWLLNSK